jgi:hypothetical protein
MGSAMPCSPQHLRKATTGGASSMHGPHFNNFQQRTYNNLPTARSRREGRVRSSYAYGFFSDIKDSIITCGAPPFLADSLSQSVLTEEFAVNTFSTPKSPFALLAVSDS